MRDTALLFSGGKDSLALLYLMREQLDNIVVLSTDTGSLFPHVTDHIQRTCDSLGAELQWVRPETRPEDQPFFPTDIVPLWKSNYVLPEQEVVQPLISSVSCCLLHRLWPIRAYMQEHNLTLGLRGTKKTDSPRGMGAAFDGEIRWSAPLWDWTDEDVYTYLENVGAELQIQYLMDRTNDSLDCWCCTGYVIDGKMAATMRFMAVHYPDKLEALKARHQRVAEIVDQEVARVRSETGYGN